MAGRAFQSFIVRGYNDSLLAVEWHAGIWNDFLFIFLLNRDGVISLSAASIFTNPFDILYSRISVAGFLLSSNDVHCSCPMISVTDEVL
jgi:hypothetical protein